jgi:hypothetical protein
MKKYLYAFLLTFSQLIILQAMHSNHEMPVKKTVSFLQASSCKKRNEDEQADFQAFANRANLRDIKGNLIDKQIRLEKYQSISTVHYYEQGYYKKDLSYEKQAIHNNEDSLKNILQFMTKGQYSINWQDRSLAEHASYAHELKMKPIDYYTFVLNLAGTIITEQADIIANQSVPAGYHNKIMSIAESKKPKQATRLSPELVAYLLAIKQENEARLNQIVELIDQHDIKNSDQEARLNQTKAILSAIEQIENRKDSIKNDLACPGLPQCIIL